MFIALFAIGVLSLGPEVSAQETNNLLRIESLDVDNQPLLGFAYEIHNTDTSEIHKISMDEEHIFEIVLPDGNYVFKEVARPEGYEQNQDLIFRLPFLNKDGEVNRRVKLTAKHSMITEKEKEPPSIGEIDDKPQTDDIQNYFRPYILVALGCILIYSSYNKKEKERTLY